MNLRQHFRTKELFKKAIENKQTVRVIMCPKRKIPILGPVVVTDNGWTAVVTIKKDVIQEVLN